MWSTVSSKAEGFEFRPGVQAKQAQWRLHTNGPQKLKLHAFLIAKKK